MINKSKLSFLLFLLTVTALTTGTGCLKEGSCSFTATPALDPQQNSTDKAAIQQYLDQNGIHALPIGDGIRYVIHEPGTGKKPESCDAILVTYEGRLMSNGAIFDSTSTPVGFGLATRITGWQIGLPLLREGGRITLYLPSGYAYGPYELEDVPANSNLIFDIELIDVL